MKRNQLEVTSKALNTESSTQASEEEKQSERTHIGASSFSRGETKTARVALCLASLHCTHALFSAYFYLAAKFVAIVKLCNAQQHVLRQVMCSLYFY